MLPDSVAMKTNNPNEVRYCCPSCMDDSFHLYFNLKKSVFHCHKCGYRGRERPEKNYSDAALEEMMGIMRGEISVDKAKSVLILPPCEAIRPGSLAMRYMLNRGVSKAKILAMGCMTSTEQAYENRVIIPVYDLGGAVVFYQARALLKSISPKYLNPVSPKRGALFFNMGHSQFGKDMHLYIVEGIFKALRFWELGLPAVAIFGKEITHDQVKLINALTGNVTIMLDPDAFNFALRMRDQMDAMREWDDIKIVNPPKAPDDMSASELLRLLEENGCDTTPA